MSIMRREECERQIDTDHEEMYDESYCEICAETKGLQHDEPIPETEGQQ